MSFLEKLKRKKHPVQIMLADDAKLSLNKISTELANHGFQNIRTFDDGKLLFDEFTHSNYSQHPDHVIVITDIEMPEMGGYELCKKIKSLSVDVKVIILSSLISDEVSTMCVECGSDSFILKREYESLIEKIDYFLDL